MNEGSSVRILWWHLESTLPMSFGWPMHPNEVMASICFSISPPMIPSCFPSVFVTPGAITLIRVFGPCFLANAGRIYVPVLFDAIPPEEGFDYNEGQFTGILPGMDVRIQRLMMVWRFWVVTFKPMSQYR